MYIHPKTRTYLILLLFFLALLFLIFPLGSALNFNLSSNITENDVKWSFDSGTYDLNIDGNITNNYVGNFYLLKDLQPNTRHYIIITSGEMSSTEWITTKKDFFHSDYFYLLSLSVIFLIISLGIYLFSFASFALGFPLLFITISQYLNDSNFIYFFTVSLIIFIISGFRAWAKYEG